MKRSTGLRNHLLVTGSLKSALDGKIIKIYSGTEPATADADIGSAVLLCTISVDGTGTGVTMDSTAVAGQVTKNPSEVWIGDILVSGTASFFRMCTSADSNGASSTAIRLQGTVGLVGTDLEFGNVTFTSGDARRLNYFVAAVPE